MRGTGKGWWADEPSTMDIRASAGAGHGLVPDRLRHRVAAMTRDEQAQPQCSFCDAPAVCVGRYENATQDEYGCDECCGHGNEDGYCTPLEDDT